MLVLEEIKRWVDTTPDKVAVVSNGERVTYSDLYGLSLSFANRLAASGVEPGDLVAVSAVHGVSFAVAYFGIQFAGAAAVPIDAALDERGLRAILTELPISVLVSDSDLGPIKRIPLSEACASFLSGREIERSSIKDLADLTANVLFTTGTTGKSKGVMLTHRNIGAAVENAKEGAGVQNDNIAYVPMPLNHVFALRRFEANLCAGATVIIQDDSKSLRRLFKTLSDENVTSLSLVPSAISYILTISGDYLGRFANQIRYVESSSAPLHEGDKQKLKSLLPLSHLYNFYGCTESTACCVLDYSVWTGLNGCVGKPCVNSDIVLLDEEGRTLPHEKGVVGRIAISGDANMKGYWNNPVETGRTLHGNLIYTNDSGTWNDKGLLCVLGRIDDVILVGGNNVAPGEVEEIICELDEVRDCAIIGVPDSLGGSALLLFAETSLDGGGLGNVVKSHLNRRVEPYKIPAFYEPVSSLPRTFNGKIDRKKLKKLYEEQRGLA